MIDAWADAHAAAARARVDVRAPATVTTLEDARAVYDATWTEADGTSQITSNLLRAVVHAGGLASVAYRDEVPVGAALAFVGRHQDSAGEWNVHLHSHMAAVLDGYRDQHIGAALKLHQRAWALDHGIDTIVWTFDPLVRRNVRLNLLKLGADVDGFEVDFYGSMDDGINTDDPTDRLFAWWRLDSDRVAAALAGGLPPVDVAARVAAGDEIRVVELPADIVAVRAADVAEATRWRTSVRQELLDGFAAGLAVIGIDASGNLVLGRKNA